MKKDQPATSEGYINNKPIVLQKRKAPYDQTEEALQRYDLLARQSRDIILFIRRDDGQILEANAAAESAYGYTREELLSRCVRDLRVPKTRGLIEGQMDEADRLGVLFETLHQRKDGTTFPVEVSSEGGTLGTTRILISVIREIASRKQAEEALQESELKYKRIFEAQEDLYYETDHDGIIKILSPSVQQLTGWSAEDLIGKPTSSVYINPDDRKELLAVLNQNGFVRDYELRLRRKNNSIVPVSLSAHVLFDRNRQPIGVAGVLRDITSRKQAEEVQRQSEELFRTTFEYASIAMAIGSPDGTFTRTNPTFDRMLGYEPGELVGVHWSAVTPVDEIAQDEERYRRFNETHLSNTSFEKRYLRKDGTIIWAHVNVSLVRDTDGTAKFAIVMIQDITERKKAAEALRESEEKYRNLFATESDALFLIDQQTGAMLDVNDAASAIYGYTREELLLMKNTDLFAEPEETAQKTKEGQVRIPMGRHIKKDGTIFPVDVSTSVCTINGRKVLLAAIRDMSEKKIKEEALLLSEKRFRSLFEASKDAILLVNQDTGQILKANPAASALYGYTHEEFVTLRDTDVSAETDKTEAAVRQSVRDVPLRLHRKKDGTIFPVEISGGYFQEAGLRLHTAFIRDISERRCAEEALRESEEKYRQVFALGSDTLVLMDEQTGMILDANDAACSVYGYTREELTQMKGSDISAEPKKTEQAIGAHETRAHLRLHKKKDGSLFPVDITASYFTLQGRRVVLGAIRDISKLKAAEEELKKHREKLATLVQERTRELKTQSKAVEELNVALKVLLRQVQADKEHLEQRFIANVNKLVLPYLEKIGKGRLDRQQSSCLDIVKTNLNEIMSPFLHKTQRLNLTPREAQVANMIKDGRTTKEIAEIIGVGPSAIDSYRNSIRMKLDLNKKKVNLQTYLQSLT